MKPVRTWVLIADAGHARVLEGRGPGRGLKAVPDMTFDNPRPEHVPGGGERGRSFESASSARHAIEPTSDPVRLDQARFAAELVGRLDERRVAKAFERLIIVSPAKMMGDLRQALGDALGRMVDGEVIADLTRVPDHEVAAHLDGVLIA
jgi:protein required for attachment to host cells